MRDPRGNVPATPSGYLTQWTYDEDDHVTAVTDARGNTVQTAYDDADRPISVTRTKSDGTRRVTATAYDAAGRVWTTTAPGGGTETRLHWPDGALKSVQSPTRALTTYGYDTAGELTSRVDPNGTQAGATASDYTWTFGYDDAGNQTSASHPDGGTRTTVYDALNRPVSVTDPNGNISTLPVRRAVDPVRWTRGFGDHAACSSCSYSAGVRWPRRAWWRARL